ncbi:Piwi domain-containing protein [uncultured Algibacter sp.]|uniref:Piwi domain-containing protein n=1 Tax=uncultured Algibacter sp. TaxID=298659 RepID=UPI00261F9E0B|nr:Piwi domain-containing protein [uncultured Algibacter sp.]
MDEIKLNFINLLNSDATIQLFRREYNQEQIEDDELYVYSLNIQKNAEEDNYRKYVISFTERDDFKEYNCSIWENNELTKRWFFYLVHRVLQTKNESNLEYNISNKRFDFSIDFITNKTNYGNQVINVAPYFLKVKKQFGFLIDFKFRKNEAAPFDKEVQRLSLSLDKNYRSNRNYYSDKSFKIQSFLHDEFLSFLTLQTENEELKFDNELVTLISNKLDNKKYVFGNEKTGLSQFHGIKNYGPFKDVETQDVIYLFLFEDKFKSFANDVYLSLIGKTNRGTFPGMTEMFGLPLSKENVEKISLNKLDVANLKEPIAQILEKKNSNPNKKIIAILLEENNEDDNIETNSPYYFLKYNLLKENIPVQVLSKESVGSPNSLKWSTSNIGLQIFSKLGGVPWLVKPSNNNCLILGIGSSHKFDEETGKIHKYSAYSVCLDSSGIYKRLSILSESENKETYLDELRTKLISLLKDEFSNYTKVVLHVPFKIQKDEIRSMEDALSQFHNIEFKVLKINIKNKFFGFSNHNTEVPYESSYIRLSNNEYLVWFEGLQYGKEIVYQRVGNPVHIKFLNSKNSSKEEDQTFLQDVVNLSGANWRGFNAKSRPISIYYSEIIAEYTKAFENFEDFDRGIFSTNKPWFL